MITPPPGLYLQVYLDAIGGYRSERLPSVLGGAARAGFRGAVLHGFPRGMVRAWDRLASTASMRGLLALASWGLDGRRDEDGSELTPAEKGALVGEVLRRSTCAAGLLDAEGQWDSNEGPVDMGEDGALRLGDALRRIAPDALVGDQPWYAIDSHGSLRTEARPMPGGGIFAGFPVDEFAKSCVNWIRARQAYIYGPGQAPTVFRRMEREWSTIRPAMERAGLARTETVTLQGYAWDHSIPDLVDVLLTWWVSRQLPVIVWAHGLPTAPFLRAVTAVQELVRLGYARPGRQAREVVVDFQRAAGLRVLDGRCGLGETIPMLEASAARG